MRRLLATGLLFAVGAALSGCLGFQGPESAVRDFTQDVQRGDVEAAHRLMTPRFDQELILFGGLPGAILSWRQDGYLSPAKETVKETDHLGDSASVVYSIQLRDGRTDQTTYYLVWLNGRWLIDWAV